MGWLRGITISASCRTPFIARSKGDEETSLLVVVSVHPQIATRIERFHLNFAAVKGVTGRPEVFVSGCAGHGVGSSTTHCGSSVREWAHDRPPCAFVSFQPVEFVAAAVGPIYFYYANAKCCC